MYKKALEKFETHKNWFGRQAQALIDAGICNPAE